VKRKYMKLLMIQLSPFSIHYYRFRCSPD